MCKRCKPNNRKKDKCMIEVCRYISFLGKLEVVGSCCGHGKYPPSIIVKNKDNQIWDLISNLNVGRKRRFYKKDKQGIYYIPEVVNGTE